MSSNDMAFAPPKSSASILGKAIDDIRDKITSYEKVLRTWYGEIAAQEAKEHGRLIDQMVKQTEEVEASLSRWRKQLNEKEVELKKIEQEGKA